MYLGSSFGLPEQAHHLKAVTSEMGGGGLLTRLLTLTDAESREETRDALAREMISAFTLFARFQISGQLYFFAERGVVNV